MKYNLSISYSHRIQLIIDLPIRINKIVTCIIILFFEVIYSLREEHRLRMLENKVLRKIFGAKRDEITGKWRQLHNAELHALYYLHNIIRNL